MDAKTPESLLKGVDVSDLAIGIQVSAQVGPNRQIVMTLGAPLSMTPQTLNAYVDKIMSVADRQNDKGILEQQKLALESARKNAMTTIEQRATCEAKFALEWTVRGRKGEFKPSGAELSQLNNFDATLKNLRETIIPKLERDIADLEAKIKAGE